ncbi:hypothetical protein THICB3320738 [Thiomonas sp. CB3]|nr:hypothetical protein THICB3320738 [Thiomonas sp. CB3]
MHYARIDTSPRLQRVAALLADGRAYTTLDIVQAAGVCAVNSAIAELRWNGYSIECRREGDVWVYRQISAPKNGAQTEEEDAA